MRAHVRGLTSLHYMCTQAFGAGAPGRAMEQAATFLDRTGIWMGLVLRRHPGVRVFVAGYVLLLHVWVLFVMYHFSTHLGAAAGLPEP